MREQRLVGLAANPAAPVEVLLRLLSPEANVCWNDLCEERDLPAEVIEAILRHPDRRVRSHLARNPVVDPRHRARLVDDPDKIVTANLAGGPRTPKGRRIARPIPDDTIRALLATGDPDVWEDLSFTTFATRVYELAATHPLPGPRAWVCQFSPTLPGELWQTLQADPDPQVRAAVAASIAYDEEVMQPASLPPHPTHAYWHILLHRRLSRDLVDHVLDRGVVEEVACLARNPSTPPDVIAALLYHASPRVRSDLAERDDLTPAELAMLAEDADLSVRTAVSVHPGLTESQRDVLTIHAPTNGDFIPNPAPTWHEDGNLSVRWAYSVNPLLRRKAARDPRLPHDTVAQLAADNDLGVRVLLAHHHPDAPSDLLLRTFLEYTGSERWHLATRPGFPVAGLGRFARDTHPIVRRVATLDPQLIGELADLLTRDPDPSVRLAAAAHPRLPQDRLHELLQDTELARHAAANPALAVANMHAILDTAGIPTA